MNSDQPVSEIRFQSLSHNILGLVLQFLTPKEICRASGTCKALRVASEKDVLWAHSSDRGSGADKKRTFLARGLVTQNVLQGKGQQLILKGHSDMIVRIQCSGSRIVTSSRDKNVCVWDTDKSKGQRLTGHTHWIVDAYPWDGKVVSVSADKTVRIWDSPTEFKSLRGHKSATNVCSFNSEEGLLATGSLDGEVKVWSLPQATEVARFNDMNCPVGSIYLQDTLLACNSQEAPTVHIFDVIQGQSVMQLATPRQQNGRRITLMSNETRSILLQHPMLYTGGVNCVNVWDLRTPSQVAGIEVPYSLVKSMKIMKGNPRGVFSMKMCEDYHTLVVGCGGLMGLLGFDSRMMRSSFYTSAHDYPILSIDVGDDTLKNIGVSSGTSTNYQYELSVHELSDPQSKSVKLIPGHKAVITATRISNDSFYCGAKNGSVTGLCFRTRKELLRKSAKTKTVVVQN